MATHDLLGRQAFIDLMKKIIANKAIKKENYSIAIDGEWGSGKTWILNEITEQLCEDSTNDYLIFYYNAWENDFYEEPLVAIISVIIEKLNEITKQKSLFEATVNQLLKEVVNDLIIVISGISKEILKLDIEKSIKHKKSLLKRIKNETQIPTDINTLLPLQNALRVTKANIMKLAESFSLIIMIDELDRCLPEYAIKILERIHHICQDMPIIQIIAYSGKALSNSISKVYAGNISDEISKKAFVDYYLEKFIHLVVPLNYGMFIDDTTVMFGNLIQTYKKSLYSDEEYLKKFFNIFLNNIPHRNRQYVFDAVKTVHELVIASTKLPDKFFSSYSLLCCEILIVMDRLLLHAQSHINFKFTYSENVMKLVFNGQYTDRYSEIVDVNNFFNSFQVFSAMCEKNMISMQQDSYHYSVAISDLFGIVLLTFLDGKNIGIRTDPYRISYDTVLKTINHNKFFLEYFYNMLYQFFDSDTINQTK